MLDNDGQCLIVPYFGVVDGKLHRKTLVRKDLTTNSNVYRCSLFGNTKHIDGNKMVQNFYKIIKKVLFSINNKFMISSKLELFI